jgi:hypothetical protein
MNAYIRLSLVVANCVNRAQRNVGRIIRSRWRRYACRLESGGSDFLHCVARALRDDYCPWLSLWSAIRRTSTEMNQIHCLALLWDSKMSKTRVIALILFWPLSSIMHALRATRIYGSYVAGQYNVLRSRQWIDQILLMSRYHITPSSYY